MLLPRPDSLWGGGSLGTGDRGHVSQPAAGQEFCVSGTQGNVTGPEQVVGVVFVYRTQ